MSRQQLQIRPAQSTRSVLNFPHVSSLMSEVEDLTTRIAERAFSFFDERGREAGHDLEDWLRAEREVVNRIPIEVIDQEKELVIHALVPGFEPEMIDIELEADAVVIKGEAKVKQESRSPETTYSEFASRRVFRRINFPELIDPSKAKAELHNGVLELLLPKSSQPVHLQIKAAS